MSLNNEEIKKAIREQYGAVAKREEASCCAPSCCAPQAPSDAELQPQNSINIGYSDEALASIPEGADLGLGCGNPTAFASLRSGETVLDLGSGAGIDAFLAAKSVGESGQVIGVDMTAEMVERARANAASAGVSNVEFRLGEIEHLPVADDSVDCIMSNCVVNLAPDKQQVFNEAYRVLKPGGRLAISDILAEKPIPGVLLSSVQAHIGCIAGAATIDETVQMLKEAGFTEVVVNREPNSKSFIREWMPELRLDEWVVSAKIQAVK